MNPEAHKIVEELETFMRSAKYALGNIDPFAYMASKMSRLQVILAEEQEKVAATMKRQTKQLIIVTWGLLILTVGLLLTLA